jgi:hypothetical protein
MSLTGLDPRYDQQIYTGKMYQLKLLNRAYPFAHIQPFICIEGTGTVNIYTSQVQHSGTADMIKKEKVNGFLNFDQLPNFIYVEPNTAGYTAIIINGAAATEA